MTLDRAVLGSARRVDVSAGAVCVLRGTGSLRARPARLPSVAAGRPVLATRLPARPADGGARR